MTSLAASALFSAPAAASAPAAVRLRSRSKMVTRPDVVSAAMAPNSASSSSSFRMPAGAASGSGASSSSSSSPRHFTSRSVSLRGGSVAARVSNSGLPASSSGGNNNNDNKGDDKKFSTPYSFLGLSTAEFPDGWKAPGARVAYTDSAPDLALMAWFMRKIAMAIDVPMPKNISYDEFIALCFLQMKGRDPDGQRDITLGIMRSLMPPGGDKVFRALFPTNKFSLELNGKITETVFAWMVGPMEVQSTVENDLGEEMFSRVHIQKCRWLQESGCTGMCVNMCKTATQDFFCNDFGLPLTIKPNFEDKSCDFYFGLTPPPIEMDEALTFGCTSTCSTAVNADVAGKPCHKLRKYEGPPIAAAGAGAK